MEPSPRPVRVSVAPETGQGMAFGDQRIIALVPVL